MFDKHIILVELKIRYREPQWQKSDDTEKKFFGSSIYFASRLPYMASFSALSAPTKIGTILTGYLDKQFPRVSLVT